MDKAKLAYLRSLVQTQAVKVRTLYAMGQLRCGAKHPSFHKLDHLHSEVTTQL